MGESGRGARLQQSASAPKQCKLDVHLKSTFCQCEIAAGEFRVKKIV